MFLFFIVIFFLLNDKDFDRITLLQFWVSFPPHTHTHTRQLAAEMFYSN